MQILALEGASTTARSDADNDPHTRYGIDASLLSGVPIFGYLTQPLVRTYGEEWLSAGILDLLFIKPAHAGALLHIETENLGQEFNRRSHLTHAYSEDEHLVAKLESWLPSTLPPVNPLATRDFDPETAQHHCCWSEMELDRPAPRHFWTPTADINQGYIQQHRGRPTFYEGPAGVVHPDYLLDACNRALMALYDPPICIHTASRLVLRNTLRVGQTLELRCIPVKKWERKGQQFVKFYLALWTEGELAVEIDQTTIFRLAS